MTSSLESLCSKMLLIYQAIKSAMYFLRVVSKELATNNGSRWFWFGLQRVVGTQMPRCQIINFNQPWSTY